MYVLYQAFVLHFQPDVGFIQDLEDLWVSLEEVSEGVWFCFDGPSLYIFGYVVFLGNLSTNHIFSFQ